MATFSRSPTYIQTLSLGGAAVACTLLACAAMVLMLLGFLMGDDGLVFASAAFMAFVIPMGAGLLRGRAFDPFEPINMVALAILYGTTARAIWLLTSSSSRVEFIMMGTTMGEVTANAPLILLSLVAMTAGYVLMPLRLPLERLDYIRNYALSRSRLKLAVLATVAISMIGIPWIIIEYGITLQNGILGLSLKRVTTYVSSEGELVYAAGFQRWLGYAVQHGFTLLAAALLARIVQPRPAIIAAVVALGVMSMITPFLASSRSSLVLLMLHLTIFAFYYRRLSIKVLTTVFIVSCVLLAVLGAIREMNMAGVQRDYSGVDRVLGAGNSFDFVRTSAIMDRVPDVVPFQYGATYAGLIGAAIPKAMWPEKPAVGLGAFVKGKIFGQSTRLGGWPSGMVAEGWINFGLFGLFGPLFLFGCMLRFFYESVRPLLGISFPITLLYAVSIWRFGFGMIGMNFSHGIAQTLGYLLPTMLLIMIAKAPRARVPVRRLARA
jgi:hypothetical protein